MNKGGGWTAICERRAIRDNTRVEKVVVLTRSTGPAAREVTIELQPAENLMVLWPGPQQKLPADLRIDHGGHIDIPVRTAYSTYPTGIVVRWRGPFGWWRRTWRSGL